MMFIRSCNKKKRGFLHLTEAVIAIILIYTVLNQMQITVTSRYGDPENFGRLTRYAKDISSALCGNDIARNYYVNGCFPADVLSITEHISADIDFRLYLVNISGGEFNKVTDEAGSEPGDNFTASAGCAVSGAYHHSSMEQESVTDCVCAIGDPTEDCTTVGMYMGCAGNPPKCTDALDTDDGCALSISGKTFTVFFDDVSVQNPEKITFGLKACRWGLYVPFFIKVLSIGGFTTVGQALYPQCGGPGEGTKEFDMTGYLPDRIGRYAVTVYNPTGTAQFNWAYLKIVNTSTEAIVTPFKVVARTWNKQGQSKITEPKIIADPASCSTSAPCHQTYPLCDGTCELGGACAFNLYGTACECV
jgi:hypothetical protein